MNETALNMYYNQGNTGEEVGQEDNQVTDGKHTDEVHHSTPQPKPLSHVHPMVRFNKNNAHNDKKL